EPRVLLLGPRLGAVEGTLVLGGVSRHRAQLHLEDELQGIRAQPGPQLSGEEVRRAWVTRITGHLARQRRREGQRARVVEASFDEVAGRPSPGPPQPLLAVGRLHGVDGLRVVLVLSVGHPGAVPTPQRWSEAGYVAGERPPTLVRDTEANP